MVKKSILEKHKYQFLEKISLNPVDEKTIDYTEEIERYIKELKTYHVSLLALSKNVPTKEERNLLLNIALVINSHEKIKQDFMTNKKLPLKQISRLVEVPLFKLQHLEDYLCAYTLLLTDQYPHLKRTLTYGLKVKEELTEVLKFMPQGMVLQCGLLQCYLLTRHGEFYRIKNQGQTVGTIASGAKKRNPLNWKKPLTFLLILFLIAFGIYRIQYSQIERTIIVRAVGEAKIDFNSFGDLVEITGTSPEGDRFVTLAEFDEKDIDTVLAEIIEQAYITRTIKERDELLIIISGEPLEEDFFYAGKTHDRIVSYQLNPKINNDGSFLGLEQN